MSLNPNEIKQSIREWLRDGGKLESPFGRIKIEELLGEGGAALVYASDFAGGAAVKFLTESTKKGHSTRYARFLSEYVNLLKLVPTGAIVPLYHFGIQEIDENIYVPYLIMERCNQTLADLCQTNKLRDITEFQNLFERLLNILDIIHNAGIVHRDIKPQNILQRPNGDWVLADFGIAWFEPEHYQKDFKTKASDRLANFEFSPPEQRRRNAYDHPKPNMDIFALGQTLYFCVTGQTIRGAGHVPMASTAPDLSKYDPIITRLVQQEPQKRPQSISQIHDLLKRNENTQSRDIQMAQMSWKQSNEFDERLRRVTPGRHGYIQIKDQRKIDRIMTSIGEDCGSYELWWTQGRRNYYVQRIRKIDHGNWLIDNWECEIIELWIYREANAQREYVALHLAERPPFGIYEPRAGRILEEAAFFDGRYITKEEFDDGYAEIDGEVVKITNAETRMRNLKEDFLFLAPHFSTIIVGENAEKAVHKVYQTLIENEGIKPATLEPLEQIVRGYWMSMLD